MASKSKKSFRKTTVTNNVDDMIFRGVFSIMQGQTGRVWVGTMTKLTTALNKVLSKKQRTLLPSSPAALRMAINRVVNRLRNKGVGVKFGRTPDHVRTRYVRFAR